MSTERFNEDVYRDELAQELRNVDNHDERLVVLSEAKRTKEYVMAAGSHAYERSAHQNTIALGEVVEKSTTLNELTNAIANGSFSIPNKFSGLDHGEHLLKRIDMAKKLGDPSFMPDVGGLREKVMAMEGGIADKEASLTYRSYIEERFPDLQLSDDEIARIEEKISPEIFATIDTPLEKTILLANALPGIKTAYSCAGHTESEGGSIHGPAQVYLSLQKLGNSNNISELDEQLGRPHGDYIASSSHGEKQSSFYFSRPPTEAWITDNGKRTPNELFSESKRLIAEILGAPEILDSTEDNFRERVVAAQDTYMANHPESATIPFAPNSRLLTNVARVTPQELEADEYRDFNFAPERWDERAQLILKLKATFAPCENKRQLSEFWRIFRKKVVNKILIQDNWLLITAIRNTCL